MPPLKNSRHEIFAQGVFKGLTAKDSAIEAKFIYNNDNSITATASRLLTYVKIQDRITELKEQASAGAVMTEKEILLRLSEIGRARLTDFVKDGDPELTEDTPNNGAAREFYKKHTYSRDGSLVITKAIKLNDPVTAMKEITLRRGGYAPEKHAIMGDFIIEVVYVDRDKHRNKAKDKGDATDPAQLSDTIH